MNFLSKESLMIGAVLAGIALILTFIAGLFGGLSFGKIIVNSFFFTFLLGIIGIGAAIMLEKMIPGIWSSDTGEQNEDSPDTPSSSGDSKSSVDFTVGDEADEVDEYASGGSKAYFPEMEGQSDSSDYEENEEEEGPSETNSNYASDDSHLMSTEVSNGYRKINGKKFLDDPEEYAKAIKTMLLKDD